MRFTKMHGLGNDFVMVNGFAEQIPEEAELPELARRLCDRRFGVGADGLILILKSGRPDAHFRMRIFNADGTEPEMCGNGIRCAVVFAMYCNLLVREEMQVETLAGLIRTTFLHDLGEVMGVRVDMGAPRLAPAEIPVLAEGERALAVPVSVGGRDLSFTAVSMGNPHCVIFVEDVDKFPVRELGPQLETAPIFPAKTNVEFVETLPDGTLKMRVWERGCGETMACGTGACATLTAAVLNEKSGRKNTVHLPGGDLEIEWAEDGHIWMTGPAKVVFEGEYYPK